MTEKSKKRLLEQVNRLITWQGKPFSEFIFDERGTVQLPPDSTGKIMDTLAVGGLERQVGIVGDDTTAAARARVVNTAPSRTDYGLVTRDIVFRDGSILSTTPLGISGVFNSTWQEVAESGTVYVQAVARADEASAALGFKIQETDDNTDSNFFRDVVSVAVVADTTTFIRGVIKGRFYRVQYTNGGTAQTTFKITESTADVAPYEVDINGRLNTNIVDSLPAGTNNIGDVDIASLPDEGQQTMANSISVAVASDQSNLPTNTIQLGGTAISLNTGVRDAGTQRVTVATDDLVPISAASLPLPAGAATSALQLADGHNVTVDNAAGASAVNIQDGGNSLTVDAPVATPANVQLSDGTDTALISTAGELVTKPEGSSVDSNNSTATPLGISGVFTGTLTDVTQLGSLSVQVFADQSSATDGLSFEWSTDGGSNWDIQDQHTITINQGEQFIIPRVAESFRIVYTNGGTAQGVFRLETILNPWPVSGEVEELDVALDAKDLALTTRSVIAGENPSGDFVNVKATTAGNFKIAIEEAEGSIQGGGTEATALRVTVATDSTGVLTVDQPTAANLNATVVATALDIRALVNTDIVTVETTADATDAAAHGASQTGFRAMGSDGTNDQQLATDASGNLQVDILTVPANQTVDVAQIAGNTTLVGNGTTGTGSQRVTIASDNTPFPVDVAGTTAADATAPDPVAMGFQASATEPSEMSANTDLVPAWADRFGRLIVVKNFPSDVSAAAHGPFTLTKTTTAIEDVVAAPSAGQSIYVTGLSCSNTSATAVRIDISDGATIRDSMFLAADGGGYVKQFDPPWELTAATALRATASAAVTDIRINTHFYIMPDSAA